MNASEKIDLFKQLKTDYKQAKTPVLLSVTSGQYLTISGSGEPGGNAFKQAVEALYSMAFTIKMTRKSHGLGDYVVCKLEALWWVDGLEDMSEIDQHLWQWKLMIRTPDCVNSDDLHKAAAALKSKGKSHETGKIMMERIDEGLCVQMLHVGPYDKEFETIAEMKAFMTANKLKSHGPHHEIYLSDPRRIEPERLKTILRYPVVEVS